MVYYGQEIKKGVIMKQIKIRNGASSVQTRILVMSRMCVYSRGEEEEVVKLPTLSSVSGDKIKRHWQLLFVIRAQGDCDRKGCQFADYKWYKFSR